MIRRWTSVIPAFAMLVFLAMGLAILKYPGLQNDELLFAAPLFRSDATVYSIPFHHWEIPIMLASYAGALKTWMYVGLFKVFAPSVWSVRVPMLLVGVATIWLTWLWVRRIAGVQAAAVATLLFATDTTFVLTNTFDWGPVALQHLFLMGGLVALQIWLDHPARRGQLALGFFLLGLGMWEKAVMIWPLAALAVAVVCVYPRELLVRMRPQALAIAAAAFLVGAAPLIAYNIHRRGATATENVKFSTEDLAQKIATLQFTIRGDALYDYIVYRPSTGPIRAPQHLYGRVADWIANHTGDHRGNLMLPACFLALLCFAGLLGFARRSPRVPRMLALLLIAMLAEWLQMALTKNAGGGAHHVVLLWPLPMVFIGVAFSAMAARIPRFGSPVLTVLVAVLVVGNLLAANRFLVTAAENGGDGAWSDAIDPLEQYLEQQPVKLVGLVDWGYLTQTEIFDHDLQPFLAYDADSPDSTVIGDMTERIFVQHADDKQMFPEINERFRKAAEARGFHERVERVIADRNGRPVFEVFRLEKAASAAGGH